MNRAAPDLRDLAPQLVRLLAAILALLRALGAHGFDKNLLLIPIIPPSATPAHAAGVACQMDHVPNEPGTAEFIAATPQAHRVRSPLRHARGLPPLKPPPPPETPETSVGWDALERPNTQPPTPLPTIPGKPGTRPIPPEFPKTALPAASTHALIVPVS